MNEGECRWMNGHILCLEICGFRVFLCPFTSFISPINPDSLIQALTHPPAFYSSSHSPSNRHSVNYPSNPIIHTTATLMGAEPLSPELIINGVINCRTGLLPITWTEFILDLLIGTPHQVQRHPPQNPTHHGRAKTSPSPHHSPNLATKVGSSLSKSSSSTCIKLRPRPWTRPLTWRSFSTPFCLLRRFDDWKALLFIWIPGRSLQKLGYIQNKPCQGPDESAEASAHHSRPGTLTALAALVSFS